MLTPDELAAIPIFSTSPVPAASLADVGRTAADMYLNAGEYAVYEGRASIFVVVIEGTIPKSSNSSDGIERKPRKARAPRRCSREIPLVFGTQFQAGFRACEV